MTVVTAGFTLNDLLAFLRVQGPGEEYRTAREWREQFGVSPERINRLLHEAQAAGVLRVDHAFRLKIDGAPTKTPVYAFELKAEKGEG